jgi:hypothetical protein
MRQEKVEGRKNGKITVEVRYCIPGCKKRIMTFEVYLAASGSSLWQELCESEESYGLEANAADFLFMYKTHIHFKTKALCAH